MPVSAYPSMSTIIAAHFDELEGSRPVKRSPDFTDGAFDVNLDADVKRRQWLIRYPLLTEAEAAQIDAHAESAKYDPEVGSAYTFNFTPRGGSLISGVRYAAGGYRKSHTKTWIQQREILLEKLP